MKKNANDRVFLCGGVFFVSRSSREFLELLTQRIRANGYFGFFCLSLHGYLSAYVDMTYFSAFHPLLLGNFVEEKDLDKQETKDALTMSISHHWICEISTLLVSCQHCCAHFPGKKEWNFDKRALTRPGCN